MIRTNIIFLILLNTLHILNAQSIDRMVIGSMGDASTSGGQDYSTFVGEAVVGSDFTTIPILTIGMEQPLTPVLLEADFINVSANRGQNGINVEWEFPVHPNTDRFLVEKSTNGADFQFIGTKGGQSFGSLYVYEDKKEEFNQPQIIFYRITRIDLSGKATKSPVVRLLLSNEALIHFDVYPNPFDDVLNIEANGQATEFELRLIDSQGKICWEGKGNDKMKLNGSLLAKGCYYLLVKGSNFHHFELVQKK
ncbi:MAG: T9SS type A sorting domain-containing protein [Bacteroidia bacterium]|nr:T9SS type A sorting domain-containing protein [Bacteroidia bacterium]